eukprot:g47051.t1
MTLRVDLGKPEILQALTALLDAVQPRWQEFQSYDELSSMQFTNKLGIFAIGYNTRWVEDIRYHYAEISSQVLVGKRLKEYLNPDKPEGKVIAIKRQKMNWKKVYYKLFEITKSEARCLELHFAFEWIPIALSRAAGDNTIQYLLPGGIPDTNGLYVIGCEEAEGEVFSPRRDYGIRVLPRVTLRRDSGSNTAGPSLLESELVDSSEVKSKIRYCYLGLAEEATIRHCILQHFQPPVKMLGLETCTINSFLAENCRAGAISRSIYIKFIEVEKEYLSAGCYHEGTLELQCGAPMIGDIGNEAWAFVVQYGLSVSHCVYCDNRIKLGCGTSPLIYALVSIVSSNNLLSNLRQSLGRD